ncbi:hypothetical protein L227DRAFT_581626 [Lentinus tigrinus ALCF2SS1-6]|uniref:Uncharacterized protein n=1 Tax=Lentinus tigrinus ALCF2SS1-6 TaxID=1328759 RepID=A0A5C2RRI6_9APHY|nr:hypothetical protein L227DRAFT_581626 [Lentinus tigrinus ALCF2SS1-6]
MYVAIPPIIDAGTGGEGQAKPPLEGERNPPRSSWAVGSPEVVEIQRNKKTG